MKKRNKHRRSGRPVNTVEISKPAYADRVNNVWSVISKHPFISSFLVVVLLTPLCFGAQQNITDSSKVLMCLLGLMLPIGVLVRLYGAKQIDAQTAAACSFGVFVVGVIISRLFSHSDRGFLYIFFYMLAAIVFFRLSLISDKEHRDRHNAFTVMAAAFSIKFTYVLYTGCYIRQNDVGSFDKETGHAAYIEYLLTNKHLPDFNPVTRWQFYHPPLHHSISAGWIDLCENFFGASRNHARESLQMLMLFYSMAMIIIVYKLLKHFGFSGRSLIVPLALFSFHPAFILSAGAINNDQLAALFTILTILVVMRWIKEPTMKNIIPIALSIGFGMMSKLNVGTIAPIVAVMFLWVMSKNSDRLLYFIKQYAVFGVICIPLALWYQIRNNIRFGTSIDYVPTVGGSQALSDDIIGRLLDLSPKQFSSPFESWIREGASYNEYNPNVAVLKNSLFGEEIRAVNFPNGTVFIPTILFWLGIILAVSAVVMSVVFLRKKYNEIPGYTKAFLGGYWLFSMFYFYLFCWEYPAVCTQNFRYLTPMIAVSTVWYAVFFKHTESAGKGTAAKAVRNVYSVLLAGFCVLSVITYLLVGYTSV